MLCGFYAKIREKKIGCVAQNIPEPVLKKTVDFVIRCTDLHIKISTLSSLSQFG